MLVRMSNTEVAPVGCRVGGRECGREFRWVIEV
jgi:hypothetical protein